MTAETTKGGARMVSGDETIRRTTGMDTARMPTMSTVLVVITGPLP